MDRMNGRVRLPNAGKGAGFVAMQDRGLSIHDTRVERVHKDRPVKKPLRVAAGCRMARSVLRLDRVSRAYVCEDQTPASSFKVRGPPGADIFYLADMSLQP